MTLSGYHLQVTDQFLKLRDFQIMLMQASANSLLTDPTSAFIQTQLSRIIASLIVCIDLLGNEAPIHVCLVSVIASRSLNYCKNYLEILFMVPYFPISLNHSKILIALNLSNNVIDDGKYATNMYSFSWHLRLLNTQTLQYELS